MENKTANAEFYNLIRDFAQTQPEWADHIKYFTVPDEQYDLTLVSQRVYGNRNEFFTIFAAAGLDSMEQPLRQQLLKLPTPNQLRLLKEQAGLK
jgi:hypothetical protein